MTVVDIAPLHVFTQSDVYDGLRLRNRVNHKGAIANKSIIFKAYNSHTGKE
ncbi:hypothetical protein [Nostoc sp.]